MAAMLREQAELSMAIKLSGIEAVLRRCDDDDDLALTALTQSPRPEWVSELLHLHSERKVGS